MGLFFLLFLALSLRALLQLEQYRTLSLYLEDALAASNLASVVVDVEEYGISHKILIESPEDAYERYRWAIKGNLNLDDQWRGRSGGVLSGPVHILNYTVFNVDGNKVNIFRYDGNGLVAEWQETLGSAVAPNGILIEATSVYSEIGFETEGFLGVLANARKGKLVDVVR